MPGIGTIDSGGVFLRFILLSALDLKQPQTLQRIERLFCLEGGRRFAIVFLLSTSDNEDGLSALGRLQVEHVSQGPASAAWICTNRPQDYGEIHQHTNPAAHLPR